MKKLRKLTEAQKKTMQKAGLKTYVKKDKSSTASFAKESDYRKVFAFHTKDELLGGITFEELITTVQSNEQDYTADTVRKTYKDLIARATADADHQLENFMEDILKEL